MNLAEALDSPDAILFIGSGVSAWSGLPSWGKLISDLANYLDHHSVGSELIRAEVKHGDLLQAASYGFDKLTRHQQGEFMREACRYGVARPSQLHKVLATVGPRCFVTTNYDNLIEESLRTWRPDIFFRPPITNRDLIGLPEIIQARAIDFIFKPHGDAADTESIVLTREQYRMLLPGGERQAVLESLKLLLVSRPVIYVGFGLRDPDFLYLRDILLNIYKGGTRDHFAIMADVSAEQIDYWRRSYGIHLISYQTTPNEDGTRDHSALLNAFDRPIKATTELDTAKTKNNGNRAETLLALARYASGISRTKKAATEFTIHVERKSGHHSDKHVDVRTFNGATAEQLLDNVATKTILLGLPGAGKSYAIRQSVARQAEILHSACLLDHPNPSEFIVPIFADLKLYQGSLTDLIAASLPAGLDFQELLKQFTVRIYFDSFNEAPRKYLESGELLTDLGKFIQTVGPTMLVVGSRTLDGLDSLGWESYELAAIEEPFVTAELAKRKIALRGRFKEEMTALLQRPFFFRYILSEEVALPDEAHPREFYRLLLNGIEQLMCSKLQQDIDLVKILKPVAYEALNSGEEAFPVGTLLRSIQANISAGKQSRQFSSDLANGLVSALILVPYSGERVAFVHQSITEYLASLELAERFSANRGLLREKLGMRRWDQALFLTLSHLSPPLDNEFFKGVLDVDLSLAVASAKFVETGREELVQALLDELFNRLETVEPHDYALETALGQGFPVGKSHLPALDRLIRSAHPIKGAAVECAINILGKAAKSEYVGLLVEHRGDYNFCANSLGPALAQFAAVDDLSILKKWAEEMESAVSAAFDIDDYIGFTEGAANFVKKLPIEVIGSYFSPTSASDLTTSPIQTEIYRRILQDRNSSQCFKRACDLLLLGDKKSTYLIYSILKYSSEQKPNPQILNNRHVEALLAFFTHQDDDEDRWAWDAIYCVCEHRADLRAVVEESAKKLPRLERAGLLMCVYQSAEPAFSALEALLSLPDNELSSLNFTAISHWNLDWSGREAMLINLLKRRNSALGDKLLGTGIPSRMQGVKSIEIEDVDWWLSWLAERLNSGDAWFASKLSSFLCAYGEDSLAHTLVCELNNPASPHRRMLTSLVLPFLGSLTTSDLSSETMAFAVNDLLHHDGPMLRETFLGGAATESFVVEILLPLLSQTNGAERERLQRALLEAGQRHGKRYF